MNRRKGFTLIELLVVITIIALLISVVVPALQKAKKKAKDVLCLNNLSQIGKCVMIYAGDNDDWIPRGALSGDVLWQQLFMPYVGGGSGSEKDFWEMGVYNCPACPDKEQVMDYVINAFSYRKDPRTQSTNQAYSAAKLSKVLSGSSYIYIADYEDRLANKLDDFEKPWIHVMTETSSLTELEYFDIWTASHLPYYEPVIKTDQGGWRVSRARHRDKGSNNLFLDGHGDFIEHDKNVPEKWNVRGW